MTNMQLYLLLGAPMLFNSLLIGILMIYMNAKFDGINAKFDAKFDGVDAKFDAVNERFQGVNQRLDDMNRRFDDMRDLWRAELHRVEEVLDARLKHLEER